MIKIGRRWRSKPKGLCLICGQPKAEYRVDIQVNIFRGDDVVLKVHQACLQSLRDSDILELAKGKELI